MEKNTNTLLSKNSRIDEKLKTCLVIGGGVGFLGQNLVNTLLSHGCSIKVLSNIPVDEIDPRIEFFLGDIQNIDDILKACTGVQTVFHVASIILPSNFISQAMRDLVQNVNVVGTHNVVKACRMLGVERLVYTSSNNVVFDREICNGDESLPYASKFIDAYTETKVEAEKIVLESNDRSGLLTCALRPGGIYGPGDKIMLPRIVEAIKKGQLLFTIGNSKALGDSVYIDNIVNAHILAALNLHPNSKTPGQAYFISDGEPSNYFNFMKPIVQSMGYKFPNISIPYSLAYGTAYCAEFFHYILNTPKPFLSRMEVMKLGLSNYFSIQKAKQELGYVPIVPQKEGVARSLPYCKELYKKIEINEKPPLILRCLIIFGMSLLALLAFHFLSYDFFTKNIMPLPSTSFLKGLFFAASLTHLGEAFYSLILMKRNQIKSIKHWFWQIILYGYPSLRLLLKKINNKSYE